MMNKMNFIDEIEKYEIHIFIISYSSFPRARAMSPLVVWDK